MMFSKLFQKQIQTEIKRAYDAGLAKGYELGWNYRKMEETNHGFIIGSKVGREIEDILRRSDKP